MSTTIENTASEALDSEPQLTIEITVSTHPRHWGDADQTACDDAARAHLRHLADWAKHHWSHAVIRTDTSLTDDLGGPVHINAYTDVDDDVDDVRALLELESDLHWDETGHETMAPEAKLQNPGALEMGGGTWVTERTMSAAKYATEEDELMWAGIRNPSLSQEQLVAAAETWVDNNDLRTTVKYDDGSEHMLMTYLTEVEEWVTAMLAAESAA